MHKYLDIQITLLFAIVLSCAMLWPLTVPPSTPEGSDKLVHLLAFAVLVLPFAISGRFGLLSVFLCTSAFGGFIEIIQPSFNRSSEFNDWVADTIGALLGVACGFAYRRL